MFNNIGKKIKALAKVLCWINIVISAIGGLLFIFLNGITYNYYGDSSRLLLSIVIGIAIIALGFLFAWIGNFFVYGFGELIDKTSEIAKNTAKDNSPEINKNTTANTGTLKIPVVNAAHEESVNDTHTPVI